MTVLELILDDDFSEAEKEFYRNKWKQLNESVMPFSTAQFDKKEDPQKIEMNRLLFLIKDPAMRQQVAKDAERWSATGIGRNPGDYIEKYLTTTFKEEHVLDLSKGKQLDESFARQFGWLIKKILERMFGMSSVPVRVKGSKEQIGALSRALAGEKEYLTKMRDLGLDNPQTYRSKAKLKTAVDKFERATGIKWPFGDK
jgi:hypothetical protein